MVSRRGFIRGVALAIAGLYLGTCKALGPIYAPEFEPPERGPLTFYVRFKSEGGDGSRERPFGTIDEALDPVPAEYCGEIEVRILGDGEPVFLTEPVSCPDFSAKAPGVEKVTVVGVDVGPHFRMGGDFSLNESVPDFYWRDVCVDGNGVGSGFTFRVCEAH